MILRYLDDAGCPITKRPTSHIQQADSDPVMGYPRPRKGWKTSYEELTQAAADAFTDGTKLRARNWAANGLRPSQRPQHITRKFGGYLEAFHVDFSGATWAQRRRNLGPHGVT